jgi:hypothetical protein
VSCPSLTILFPSKPAFDATTGTGMCGTFNFHGEKEIIRGGFKRSMVEYKMNLLITLFLAVVCLAFSIRFEQELKA